MAELENIIESVMSSPDSMSKIMDVVKMFGVSNEEEKKEEKKPDMLQVPELLPGGIEPEMLSKIMELLKEYNAGDDRRIRLLGALRPYLKNEDATHIDRAIHIVKLSHVAKSVFKNFLGRGGMGGV